MQWTEIADHPSIPTIAMARGQKTSKDLRWAIVRMAALQEDLNKVAVYAGISLRQVHRVLALHRATGDVAEEPHPQNLGRPRHLDDFDVLVSFPDIYSKS
jgi:hypothetical protein